MPRFRDDPNAPPADEEEGSFVEESQRRARRVIDGFIDFALQGNILEIAFGLMSVESTRSEAPFGANRNERKRRRD